MPPIPKKIVALAAPIAPAARPLFGKSAVKVVEPAAEPTAVEPEWCMDASSWTRRTITWHKHPKDEPHVPTVAKLIAYVYGNVAVHQSPYGEMWHVTHVPTGRALVTGLDNQDHAYRIGEWLQRELPLPLSKSTPEELKAEVPAEVQDWTWCCKTSGTWIDPNDKATILKLLEGKK